MKYSVMFYDGKRWRQWSLGHPANLYIGTHIDILFDIIKTIVSFHNLAIVKPVLYQRSYYNGYHSDPEYIPLCNICELRELRGYTKGLSQLTDLESNV